MTNTLEKIISDKKNYIENYKKSFTIEDLKKRISLNKNYLSFKDKLKKMKFLLLQRLKKQVPLQELLLKIMTLWQLQKNTQTLERLVFLFKLKRIILKENLSI